MRETPSWSSPAVHLSRHAPDAALFYFAPETLQATALRFLKGFPGLVTYAVKANSGEEVLANLVAAGITAFDVASPQEMQAVRALCPGAVLHYNNPVRSGREVEIARELRVASYSVDCAEELAKLGAVPQGTEIAVRLALPVEGAAYHFGEKFGASPAEAVALLRRVAELGYAPAITFHPGTQCADPAAWASYIEAAANVSRDAGVSIGRLNVGGGFAAHRAGKAPDLEGIFDRIARVTRATFGATPPVLVCEPGRAMVADAVTLATRVKSRRGQGAIYLNDGVYGGLAEARDIGLGDRIRVLAPDGRARCGTSYPLTVFGPTCDSLDRLPDPVPLPGDLEEGDFVLFDGMGAYSMSLATGFNGYGPEETVTVGTLR